MHRLYSLVSRAAEAGRRGTVYTKGDDREESGGAAVLHARARIAREPHSGNLTQFVHLRMDTIKTKLLLLRLAVEPHD